MKCPTAAEEWRAISDKFAERWNFPHTCGTLDGKHVNCKCPPNSGSLYYNHKGFYSVVLMALVDADYKFIWVDIGGMGSDPDLGSLSRLAVAKLSGMPLNRPRC